MLPEDTQGCAFVCVSLYIAVQLVLLPHPLLDLLWSSLGSQGGVLRLELSLFFFLLRLELSSFRLLSNFGFLSH